MKRTFTITVPIVGYQVYEVEAETAEQAVDWLKEHEGRGARILCIEENAGDWVDCDWEIEEDEE